MPIQFSAELQPTQRLPGSAPTNDGSRLSVADRVYRKDQISVGLTLPIRQTPGPTVEFRRQVDLAIRAENAGIAAIWVRDVPLNGAWYPENFGHLDPFVMLGALAVHTTKIALGTAAIVLPLRHPLHIAKAAASLQTLSDGRLILGVGSGDREAEYAAFGKNLAERRTLFRENWERLTCALENPQWIIPDLPGGPDEYAIWPKVEGPIPMIAVGSGGQTLGWIAEHASGWATYHRTPEAQKDRYGLWRQAVERSAPGKFRSFSQAVRIDLLADRKASSEEIDLGYRTGIEGLLEIIRALGDAGVHHAMINLVPNGRPPEALIGEIGEYLIPAL